MLSRHDSLECRIMGMLAVFAEQLLIVDVVFVHEVPFENEQTPYMKVVNIPNVWSAFVHRLLGFVAPLKIDDRVSKKKENV